jgi:hypothetical protein
MGKVDIVKKGEMYGYVSLTGISEVRKRARYVEAECVCGNIKFYRFSNLKDGVAKSCGCKTHSMRIEKISTHGMASTNKKKGHPIFFCIS